LNIGIPGYRMLIRAVAILRYNIFYTLQKNISVITLVLQQGAAITHRKTALLQLTYTNKTGNLFTAFASPFFQYPMLTRAYSPESNEYPLQRKHLALQSNHSRL
jgi:hypothetical protein